MTGLKVFYLRVKTQFDNQGDALINRELLNILGTFGQLRVNIERAPSEFQSWLCPPPKHELTNEALAFQFLNAWQFRRRGEEYWLVLNPGAVSGELSWFGWTKAWFAIMFLNLFRLSGGKIIRIGVSYDTIGPRHAAALHRIAKATDLHLVRDSRSKKLCDALGIGTHGIIPDLAFWLPPTEVNNEPKSDVAFSFRSKSTTQLRSLRRLIKTIPNEKLVFSWQVRRDEAFARALYSENPRGELRPCLTSISDTRQFYSRCKSLFTNRLHVFLMALSVGCPAFLLLEQERDQKIKGIVDDANLGFLLLSAQNLDALQLDDQTLLEIRKRIATAYKRSRRHLIEKLHKHLGA